MNVPFYLLGLLQRYGPQHGYLLKQTIEEQIADFAQIKLPTIYYHLEKLNDKGYVTAVPGRDKNRPEKTVYSITQTGQKYFSVLMKQQLTEPYRPQFALDGVLFFHDCLPDSEFYTALGESIEKLEQRIQKLELRRKNSLPYVPEKERVMVQALFSHHLCHLKAELEWIKSLKKDKPSF